MAKTYEDYSEERKALQEMGWYPEWYTTSAYQIFTQRYSVEGEEGLKGRYQTISKTLASYLPEYMRVEWEGRFFEILWKKWLSPASPIVSNCGTTRGLTVSCSGGVIGDSIESFYENLQEQAILSKNGFGCSADFSRIRPRGTPISAGGEASGACPVIEDFATMASKVSQGSSRRGSTASYLNIEHGDFFELCDMILHEPDGLNIGWIVGDSFIKRLKEGDEDANLRFQRSLYVKLVTGKGYFFFIDKVNRARPESYVRLNKYVHASNLCNEIRLNSEEGPMGEFDSDEGGLSFSCVLSSMNLEKYFEWKDTDAVFVATVFLDCVVSDFLAKSHGINGLQKVHRFTRLGRPIGLGVMGFGTLLQANRIPYESLEADYLDDEIFEKLDVDSLEASKWLASVLGEPEWCKGLGVRNTHRIALAPTKTTANLMGGVSESSSPDPAMIWTQASAAGEIARIAPEFLKHLKSKNLYNDEIINSIIAKQGSCQHLINEFSDEDREVFKTAFEIDQRVILRRAARRQKRIDQGQSLNLYISSNGDEDRIAELHSMAFLNEDVHGLYYIYSTTATVVEKPVCSVCEG